MTQPAKIAVVGASGRAGHHAVDLLCARGHEVVPISRTHGVDIITGEGLAEALVGVDTIIDAATGPSPEQEPATEFFITATHNLQTEGARAGVRRLVVASIIGTDRFTTGYGAAKVAHERAALAGPIPAYIVRASQFHELVAQLIDWGRQGDVSYVPRMRTQLVAARTAAEALVDVATSPNGNGRTFSEIAGPREESLVEVASLLAARRGDPARVEPLSGPKTPEVELYESGAMLPGPDAVLAGPTFAQWLDAESA
jgi:uncharacterized protein YbjT (DUF2867 family)